MDSNKIIKITNAKQFEKMIELLEQNPSLGRGFNNGSNKLNVKLEWNKIAEKLNVLGPPTRTGEGWMKVWADYKFKLKKKLAQNKRISYATGDDSNKQHVLSATEKAASNLLQFDIFNKRSTNASHPSLYETTAPFDKEFPIIENINSCTSYIIREFTPQGESDEKLFSQKETLNITSAKTELLEEQLKIQSALFSDVKKSLAEIEKYQRKIFLLKVEKLKIMKDNLKKKNAYREEMLQLKKEEIEIKKRRID